MLTWVLGCADSRTPSSNTLVQDSGPDAAGATRDAQPEASTEPVEVEILEASCGFPRFGEDWELAENGDFDCLRQSDCGPPGGRGLCIGRPAATAGCQAGAADACPKRIGATSCVFQPCITDSDCESWLTSQSRAESYSCVCTDQPSNFCVADACRSDADCATGQRCKLDYTALGHPGAPHCTTPDDQCKSDADCPDSIDNICGWSFAGRKRWECQAGVIID